VPVPLSSPPFQFLDPGPLIDSELELVSPHAAWIDDVLAACHHPLTVRDAPIDARTTRQQLRHFVETCPQGRQAADTLSGTAPAYHFWMRLREPFDGLPGMPAVRIAGGLGLRIGVSPDLENYYGHVGYHVYPPARGRHYAERAVRLVLPIARGHGMRAIWITCNPDNLASRRTCERLGAQLIETVDVPPNHPLALRGEHRKCRYLLAL
jgi:tagatose 1,6-diphosphate aldolase